AGEELVLAVRIERNESGEPPRDPRVTGQRAVLRAREPPPARRPAQHRRDRDGAERIEPPIGIHSVLPARATARTILRRGYGCATKGTPRPWTGQSFRGKFVIGRPSADSNWGGVGRRWVEIKVAL